MFYAQNLSLKETPWLMRRRAISHGKLILHWDGGSVQNSILDGVFTASHWLRLAGRPMKNVHLAWFELFTNRWACQKPVTNRWACHVENYCHNVFNEKKYHYFWCFNIYTNAYKKHGCVQVRKDFDKRLCKKKFADCHEQRAQINSW